MFIAHHRKFDQAEQILATHLTEVSELARELTQKINVPKAGELLGLLHDFGKYSSAFQNYIQSATGKIDPDADDYVDAKQLKGKIDHSSAGAQYVWEALRKYGAAGQGELCGQMLALCIASHHSGLIDCLDEKGNNIFWTRMNKEDAKTHRAECLQQADAIIMTKAQQLASKELVMELFASIRKILEDLTNPKIIAFNLGFLSRFLFSCLVDADRLNSAEFEYPARKKIRLENQHVDWKIAIDRLEMQLADFPIRDPIDPIRREISDHCKHRATEKQGIYTLTVPTGGGKTYASLRYALHHAATHKLERIIYIIPYTSIIEQNAAAIREVLECEGDDKPWVLEHHASLEPETQTWRTKLVTENWDAPIVLTTMVQFLETLFNDGTRGVRRFHQLANTVLIFDEIQTLPINCVHLFCNALNFLTTYTQTTAVLCTATQPLLNRLKAPEKGQLNIPEGNELVQDTRQLFADLKRVEIHNKCKTGGWQSDEIVELALSELMHKGSCLIIVNTKEWARQLYKLCAISVDSSVIFHLSTNQYPAHRKQLLTQIRERLDQKKSVLCISTQLIEAGVDIDFASVIRFLAGLDSVAQAAGRCNRHGRQAMGEVHLVNPVAESLEMLPDIKIGQEKMRRILDEGGELLNPETITRYFNYYFFERAGQMLYPLTAKQLGRDDNLLNLLSDNHNNVGYKAWDRDKVPLLQQSFMTAGRLFKAIDAPTQAVIIPHGQGKLLVTQLRAVAENFEAKAYADLLKKAQGYSVNVFPNVWKKLCELEAVHELRAGDGIYYLDEKYYDEAFGLSTEAVV
ncbi:MAG: CRISPR-associated helicase Cas3 domain protein [Pseudomonadota bacterium]